MTSKLSFFILGLIAVAKVRSQDHISIPNSLTNVFVCFIDRLSKATRGTTRSNSSATTQPARGTPATTKNPPVARSRVRPARIIQHTAKFLIPDSSAVSNSTQATTPTLKQDARYSTSVREVDDRTPSYARMAPFLTRKNWSVTGGTTSIAHRPKASILSTKQSSGRWKRPTGIFINIVSRFRLYQLNLRFP